MNYKTIWTAGQLTAVITDSQIDNNLSEIAKSIMAKNSQIEQVGILTGRNFQMMGGELSINGLIAGAYVVNKSGDINNFSFIKSGNVVSLELPISIIISSNNNEIALEGIKYLLISGLPNTRVLSSSIKEKLIDISKNSPASGIIYYDKGKIVPLVYVQGTGTYIWENACGSGSLAYSLFSGEKVVIQPSGESIQFNISKNIITVTETVKEI